MFTTVLLLCTLGTMSFANAGTVKANPHCPNDLFFHEKGEFCYDPRDVTKAPEVELKRQYAGCCGNPPCWQQPCQPTYPDCSGYPGHGQPVGTCPQCDDKCNVTFLADSRDCDVFYICHCGQPVWKRCPSGLHFNPNVGMCDYPQNCACSHNPTPCPYSM